MNQTTIGKLYFIISLLSLPVNGYAGTIRGRAQDVATGQPVVGATLIVENTKLYNVSGLDGSYLIKNVPMGVHKIRISYVSYRTMSRDVTIETAGQGVTIDLALETDNDRQLTEVTVKAKRDGTSDRTARDLERNALQVTNIVSGRIIELSPDLTVANAVSNKFTTTKISYVSAGYTM